jgi:hypothetical protein
MRFDEVAFGEQIVQRDRRVDEVAVRAGRQCGEVDEVNHRVGHDEDLRSGCCR